jgi:DNA-directed RNA polymerase subunit RPC12/RpoP
MTFEFPCSECSKRELYKATPVNFIDGVASMKLKCPECKSEFALVMTITPIKVSRNNIIPFIKE